MKKISFISLLLFLFFACQSVEKTEEPENLIPEEKMVEVLVDLAKLDASVSYNESAFLKRQVKIKKIIFSKYSIDSLQFAKSSNYYAEDFTRNQRIYDNVKARLERDKARVDSILKVEDSLRVQKKKGSLKALKKKQTSKASK